MELTQKDNEILQKALNKIALNHSIDLNKFESDFLTDSYGLIVMHRFYGDITSSIEDFLKLVKKVEIKSYKEVKK